VAEEGAKRSRVITYAVIRTGSPATIKADKARLLSHLKTRTDGGIWTIETGQTVHGLHLNIVAGGNDPLTADALAERWRVDADVWAEEVPNEDARNVAAYSAKQAGFPDREEYGGHLYGSFGSWKTPLQALSSQRTAKSNPIAHAAALNEQLRHCIPEPPPFTEPPPTFRPPMPEGGPFSGTETAAQRRERHERNQQEAARARAQFEEEQRKWATRKHLRHLFAAYAGEVDTKGVVYVDGYGIATRGDFVALGILTGSTAGAREDWQEEAEQAQRLADLRGALRGRR
jgi:hypothetical protein